MRIINLIICSVFAFNYAFGQVKNVRDDGRKIRIPVVFHVLYSNEAENISDELILNELNDLNLDFAARNDMSSLDSYFRSLVGNPNIEFYLVDKMIQSIGSKGIERVLDKDINPEKLLINSNACLNVYIADQGNASDILSDRVNLNYLDVGRHSHVLTHETGHWLGLYHIWGKIGSCSTLKIVFGSHDDDIDDTPAQWSCTDLSYSTDCPPKGKLYYKGHKILYNNFMDYNGCRCMFTLKQAIQMRNSIIATKPLLFP